MAADGSHLTLISATDGLKTQFERDIGLLELEQELGELAQDHWVEARSHVEALPCGEFNADIVALAALATAIATAAQALSALTGNSISCDGPTQKPAALADLFDEATDGLLVPTAAKVLSAMVRVRLAGGTL